MKELTVKRVAKALLTAQSGGEGAIVLDVMTNYTCTSCQKITLWGHSATPLYCGECAEVVAESMLKSLGYVPASTN